MKLFSHLFNGRAGGVASHAEAWIETGITPVVNMVLKRRLPRGGVD